MNSIFRIAILVCTCTCASCYAGSATLDLTELPYSANDIQIIDRHMPDHLRSRYINRGVTPALLSQYMRLLRYPSTLRPADSLVLIYYSSGSGISELQLLKCSGSSCISLDHTAAVRGGMQVMIRLMDIDCDGINEVYTSCMWGATQMFSMSVFAIENDKLVPWTPTDKDSLLTGLRIELVDRDSNCVKELELQTPRPRGYSPDSLKTYHFDKDAQQFIHSKTENYKDSKASKHK